MKRFFRVFVCISFICFFAQLSLLKDAEARTFSELEPAAKVGLVAASAVSSGVYFPFKLTYAVLGGITSGLTYGVTLGKEAEAANKIAMRSFTGDWYIHPNILLGEEDLNFVGPDDVSP